MDLFIPALEQLTERWPEELLQFKNDADEQSEYWRAVRFLNPDSDIHFEVAAEADAAFIFTAHISERNPYFPNRTILSEMWELDMGELPDGTKIQSQDHFVKYVVDWLNAFIFSELIIVAKPSLLIQQYIWLKKGEGWEILETTSFLRLNLKRQKPFCLNYSPPIARE